MQERKIINTSDGSQTVQIPELNVTYHSIHGAVQESMHVFIEAGLRFKLQEASLKTIFVFEMGFGTGLNALLTALEAQKVGTPVYYTAIELYPLTESEFSQLNYKNIGNEADALFQKIHDCKWNEDVRISEYFTLKKVNTNLLNFSTGQLYDLIYYDAFAPSAQPELWSQVVFEKLHAILTDNGVLVTYCAKGDVRRAMLSAGFTVKKMPGPPGKREMLRAIKL